MDLKDQLNDLCEIWEFDDSAIWELKEPEAADGKTVLAVAEGPMFVLDGESRNKRFYTKKLWEGALVDPEVKRRLKEGLMFGMIGHENKPVDEKDLAEGRVSHIIQELWADPKTNLGMGRMKILATEAGKNLYIYMKAGSKLRTSSRAKGRFNGESGKGIPKVDESTYRLHTFDFVIEAGFDQALPSLKESLDAKKENFPMDLDVVVKTLTESRDRTQRDLDEALRSIEELKKKLAESDTKLAEVSSISEGIAMFPSEVRYVLETVPPQKLLKFARISGELSEEALAIISEHPNIELVLEEYEKYADIGSAEEIMNTLEQAKEILKAYTDLGSVLEVKTKEELLQESLGGFESIGSAEAIQAHLTEVKDVLEKYTGIGSIEEITSSIEEALIVLDGYTALGSVEGIKQKLNKLSSLKETLHEKEVDEGVVNLSQDFDITQEAVRPLVEKLGEMAARELLENTNLRGSAGVKSPSSGGKREGDRPLDESRSLFNSDPLRTVFERMVH